MIVDYSMEISKCNAEYATKKTVVFLSTSFLLLTVTEVSIFPPLPTSTQCPLFPWAIPPLLFMSMGHV